MALATATARARRWYSQGRTTSGQEDNAAAAAAAAGSGPVTSSTPRRLVSSPMTWSVSLRSPAAAAAPADARQARAQRSDERCTDVRGAQRWVLPTQRSGYVSMRVAALMHPARKLTGACSAVRLRLRGAASCPPHPREQPWVSAHIHPRVSAGGQYARDGCARRLGNALACARRPRPPSRGARTCCRIRSASPAGTRAGSNPGP